MAGQDFVHVQLSAAGVAMAKGGALHVHAGRVDLVFTPGQAQRVTMAYDWSVVLAGFQVKGEPLFELASEAPAAVIAAAPAMFVPPASLPVRPASSPAHDAAPVNHPGAVDHVAPQKAGGN